MHNALQSFHHNFPDRNEKNEEEEEKRRKEQQSKIHRKQRAKFHSRVRVLSDLSTLRTSSLCCPMHTQQRRRPEARYRLNPATFFFSPRPPLLDSLSPSSSLPPLPRPPAVNINWTARLTKRVVANSRGLSVPSRLAQWLMDKSRRVMLISAQSLRQNACAPLMNIHRAI